MRLLLRIALITLLVFNGVYLVSLDNETSAQRAYYPGVSPWVTVPFLAGDFTGGASMTWTVASGDLTTFQYSMLSPTSMALQVTVINSTIAGTPSNELRVNIPNNKQTKERSGGSIIVTNNGTEADGRYIATNGLTYVSVFQEAPATAWSDAGADDCDVHLSIIIDVEERP